MATNTSPGRMRRVSWVPPPTPTEPSPRAMTPSVSAARAPSVSRVEVSDISLQFTRDARDATAARYTAGETARPTRRIQVLRRQGRVAVRRQGQLAAQPRALLLSEDGRPRASQGADGHRGRGH